jgi:hypothetical protein
VSGLRIIVCGGRDYRDRTAVWGALDRLHAERGIAAVIQGAADGADRHAAEWGWAHPPVRVCSFPADWDSHGRAAGPKRNARMIAEGKPDGVVAFPGGRGTADMVRQAEAAGLKVWRPAQ